MGSDAALVFAMEAVRGIQTDLAGVFVEVSADPVASTGEQSQPGSKPATVFISWAHAHASWSKRQVEAWEGAVATLASTLRTEFGVDADVDLFHLHEAVDWTRFGQQRIVTSERVLIVLSRAWAERWAGTNAPTEGAGAAREADALHGLFSRDQQAWQDKLVIVLLPDASIDDLPPDLDRVPRVAVDPSDPDSYEGLIRLLTGQPRYQMPSLGATPELPPLSNERTLAALRAQLASVRKRSRESSRNKSASSVDLDRLLATQEAAIRGFIEAALRDTE